MSQQQLGKPQVPSPDQSLYSVVNTTNTLTLSQILKTLLTYLNSLVLYLNTYLGRIYSTLVPFQYSVSQVSALQSPYQVGATDVLVAASASSTAATEVDLPATAGTGRVVIVVKMDSNPFNINVVATGNDQINATLTAFSASSAGPAILIKNQFDAALLIDVIAGTWLAYSWSAANVNA